jgi:hypothetical protein
MELFTISAAEVQTLLTQISAGVGMVLTVIIAAIVAAGKK